MNNPFTRGNNLTSHTTVSLTPLGKSKVESCSESGLRYRVIEALDQEPKTISELSRELNIDSGTIAKVVSNLRKSQYVHTLRGEE